jgi:uncharacterized protein DUF3761
MASGSATRNRAGRAFAGVLVALCALLIGCGGSVSTRGTTLRQTEAAATVSTASTTTSAQPLRLHLDAGSHTITASQTTLHGTASGGASVVVNGAPAPLHNGRWQLTLRPHLGANRITVEATMGGHAPVARAITITRQRSAAELEARTAAKREAEARATATREADARRSEARREAEKRRTEARRETETSERCTNGTYVNAAGNTVCKPETSPTVPAGATARCGDGTYSFSESRSGTCSHHEGVAEWLSP